MPKTLDVKNLGLMVLSEQQLQKQCQELGIEADGSREQLIKRILEHDTDEEEFSSLNRYDNEAENEAENDEEQSRVVTRRRNDIRFDDIKSCFTKFNGDKFSDVNVWISHFERQCKTYGLSLLQRFAFAHRLFTDTAKLFVEYESTASCWKELKFELISEYGAKTDSIIIHTRLGERKKNKDESVIQYMYVMLGIAKQGNVDEASIVRYVIDGLPGNAANKSFMYEARSIYMLKQKLETYEYVSPKFENDGRTDKKERVVKKTTEGDSKNYSAKKIHCFSCGDSSHTSNSCPHKEKGPKCFSCNEFGHKSVDCKNKVKKDVPAKVNIMRRKHNVYLNVVVNGVVLNALFDTGYYGDS